VGIGPVLRQWSEQYLTSSQTFSHFFRQAKGRPQQAHILVGKSAFLRILGIASCRLSQCMNPLIFKPLGLRFVRFPSKRFVRITVPLAIVC
jgi:hypothetical protein